ncbi:hypothetical protein PQX77_005740 [Marasmius sp. AFHP31]|nr:hypothetical protein PQX77_005740 [Marasmius sp. AFHP31]
MADKELEELRGLLETLEEDDEQREAFLGKKGDDAQYWLDMLQLLADSPDVSSRLRSTIFRVMIRLSKNSGCCPGCLVIQNVEKQGKYPVGGGGFGDVWKGTVGHPGSVQTVCLKVVKVYLTSDVQRSLKEYLREAIVWKQLRHPNLLPFLGIYYLDDTRQEICLVSPWMDRGNLVQYLKDNPQESVNHLSLISDVASGLSHLHIMKIVHADLKGVNILITPSGRACICDFGLSRIADSQVFRLSSSATRPMGTVRWQAPELLNENEIATKESDIYAFACVCYEILTGLFPFHECRNDGAVIRQLSLGKRPSRPETLSESFNTVWEMIEACWQADPPARPSASTIVKDLTAMSPESITPVSAWDDSIGVHLWSNLEQPIASSGAAEPVRSGQNTRSLTRKVSTAVGMHIRWIQDQKRRQKGLSNPPKFDVDSEENRASEPLNYAKNLSHLHPGLQRSSSSDSANSDTSGSYASTSSSTLMRYFPKRFFVIKAASEDILLESIETGVWSNGTVDEELERASRTSVEVYLIFGLKNKEEFWGYAKMAGTSRSRSKQSLSRSLSSESLGTSGKPLNLAIGDENIVPQAPGSPTSPLIAILDLETEPTAHTDTPELMDPSDLLKSLSSTPSLVGDETPQSPTPFARNPEEIRPVSTELDNVIPTPAPPDQLSLDGVIDKLGSLQASRNDDDPWGQSGGDVTERTPEVELGGSMTVGNGPLPDEFKIEWLCTERLPHTRTRHIRNPWNRDREVGFSGDGRELEPGVGQQLIDEWQRYLVEQRAGDRGLLRRRQTGSSSSLGREAGGES